MTRRRNTLGVLIDHSDYLGGGYEGRLRSAFEAECRKLGFDLLMFTGRPLENPGYEAQNGIYDLVHGDCVDAAVVIATGLATYTGVAGVSRLCTRYGTLPLFSLGLEVPGIPSVVLDNRPGMRALVEHLILQHRCRRPAYIGGPENNPDAKVREQVFSEVLRQHGIACEPVYRERGLFTLPSGAEAMTAILGRRQDFDAVIAASDLMALGAIEVLKARGLRVPQQIRVAGFDDLDVARLSSPPLTTASQPLERMAAVAVQLVLAELRGERASPRIDFASEMVVRRSCGCSSTTESRSSMPAVRPDRAGLSLRAERLVQRAAEGLRVLRSSARSAALALVSGLFAELDGRSGSFLIGVEEAVELSGEQPEAFEELQNVISFLRAEAAEFAPPLEDVWHEARSLVAHGNTRANVRYRLKGDMAYWHLLRSGERLLTAFDLPSLKTILAEELPAMHVNNAVLSLYRDASRSELEPFLCLRQGQVVQSAVTRYRATELIPSDFPLSPTPRTAFVWPLAADAEEFGVLVLEVDPGAGAHEMLREQISAALRSAALHREIVHRTAMQERRVQERLATAERMSALNVLAGGVAHDLNNALGPLVALPEIMLRELDELSHDPRREQGELRADVVEIRSAALRAAQTIKDLLTAARQGHTDKQTCDLNLTVQRCVRSELLACGRGVDSLEITVELWAEPLPVLASESHVARAVANLLRNAVEAVADRGRISVRTAIVKISEALGGYETVEPGCYASIAISDTGRGIPQPDRRRVFEPFFSTKTGGESGTGLGLAIVHGVVKEHGGFVNLESVVDAGTTFTLFFPRSELPLSSSELSPVPELRAGSRRVLVVDDDPVQLRTARRVLERFGYSVATVKTGREALSLFEATQAGNQRQTPCDLLVLDMLLNEADDGLALFDRIVRLCPEQRCIIASGHAPTERGLVALQRGLIWLEKPYTAEALARAVDTALTRPAIPKPPSGGAGRERPSARA